MSESSGGSRRLAKLNKAPSPSSGSTSSTGSSGGKEKLKKVNWGKLLALLFLLLLWHSSSELIK